MTKSNSGNEDSSIFVGTTIQGQYFTVSDYAAAEAANIEALPVLYCPHCLEEKGEPQELVFHEGSEGGRFVHKSTDRDCFRDDRCKDRNHPLLVQTILAEWQNSDRHWDVELEYAIRDNNFDCGAKVESGDLDGVVAEIQHQCSMFRKRIRRKIRVAHRHNHGIYVVFSPSSDDWTWFRNLLRRHFDGPANVGSYENGRLHVGTMISPGEIDLLDLARDSGVKNKQPSKTLVDY